VIAGTFDDVVHAIPNRAETQNPLTGADSSMTMLVIVSTGNFLRVRQRLSLGAAGQTGPSGGMHAQIVQFWLPEIDRKMAVR
jgi:hypothetical protein